MLRRIANSRISKAVAIGLSITMLITDFFHPSKAWALTNGPSQPEFDSFEPAATSEMVDLFTGDFTYNIPLLDVDGYPVNLSYHASPKMDQEASWVGLGWNINAGAVNRSMRGLPDDFNGDKVKHQLNIKPVKTWGVTGGHNLEVSVGKDMAKGGLDMSLGVVYNNYKGVGFQFGFDITGGISASKGLRPGLNAGLGVKANTQEGIDISPSLGLDAHLGKKGSFDTGLGINIGLTSNSRQGLKYRTLGVTAQGGGGNSNGGAGLGIGLQAVVPSGSQTYIPNLSVNQSAFSMGVNFKAGPYTCLIFPNWSIKGYYTEQGIEEYEKNNAFFSYGYLYSQNNDAASASSGELAVHDFNREKDGAFHTETPNLPVTNYTYDLFSATGQGMGTMFRSRRSDVGTVYDKSSGSSSMGFGLSGELGTPPPVIPPVNDFHVGANANAMFFDAQSGIWSAAEGNNSLENVQFIDSDEATGTTGYEESYMKAIGEQTLTDASFQQSMGGEDAVRFGLTMTGANSVSVKNQLVNNAGTATNITGKIFRGSRDIRNQAISYLAQDEASKVGLDKTINDYPENTFTLNSVGDENVLHTTSRTATGSVSHISEVNVLSEGGARYVYGIPAYNTKQKEVTFNASGNTVECTSGLVQYASGTDNSTDNDNGMDNYYESKELPPYAHSYLLTALLSPDYIDKTGDGPTSDDLGNYTKFNYSKLTGYKWRAPFEHERASYNEGLKSDTQDDKGSYIYGEKDIWYTHSIETKNYIAVFTLSERKDGYGVTDENGGINTSRSLKKLDKITLYAKRDVMEHGMHAVPIKTVHFEYDYSMCPHTLNNNDYLNGASTNTGKLTLAKVYFTYGRSEKGRLNPYTFYYADPDHDRVINTTSNPTYDTQAFDRWGNYKPNTTTGCAPHDPLSNAEYPYTPQDKTNEDIYSAAWCLNTIDLPSGGSINVDYEADDYAYVQDVRAGQMFKVIGANSTSTYVSGKNTLYDALNSTLEIYSSNDYLFVDLGAGYPVTAGAGHFKDEYLDGISKMYFRFLLRIGKNTNESDFVPGYADIDLAGCTADPASIVGGNYTRGIIKLKSVGIDDPEPLVNMTNAISKAGWQMSRLELSQVIYPGSAPAATNKNAFMGLLTLISDVSAMAKGVNRMLRSKNYSREFDIDKSMVRLSSPAKKKLGGGCRVRQIITKDAWSSMVNDAVAGSEHDSEYGQVFDYTKKENGQTISSGVASYEPMIGGDENSVHKPVDFSVKHEYMPNDEFFMEEPIGESLYPSPVVGYSKITVQSILPNTVTRHATGKTEYEFYTSKDFPVIADRTPLQKERVKPKLLKRLLDIGVKDDMYLSQGYVVKLNDMHGKPKSKRTFATGQTLPIASVKYDYRTKAGSTKNTLDNNVAVIGKDNVISMHTIATDIDMVADARKSTSDVTAYGLNFNFESSACWLNIPLAMVWPAYSSEETSFNSITATKVVQQYGVLEKITATDNNSAVTTENLLYDSETGHVLLTRTNNEFNDPVYAFQYPAHWAYDHMGQAYRNLGAMFKNAFNTTTGLCSLSSPVQEEFIVAGDEIEVAEDTGTSLVIDNNRYWVSSDAAGSRYLIKRDGTIATFNSNDHYFKIIRSGRRNQQGTPVGAVSTLTDPRVSSALDLSNKIINSSAVEMSEDRKLFNATNAVNEGIQCSESAANSVALEGLLSTLAGAGTLAAGSGVSLTASPYSSYYTPLATLLGTGNNKWYTTSTTSSQLNAVIKSCLACREECTVTLSCATSPCSITWSDITGFSNLTYSFDPATSNPAGVNYTFTIIAGLSDGNSITLNGSTSCIPVCVCRGVEDPYADCTNQEDVINPYVAGNRGTWYAHKSYSYLTGREKGITQSVPDIRDDGAYASYKPFWLYSGTTGAWLPVNSSDRSDYNSSSPFDKWIMSSENTKVSQYGTVHETKDALGNYSSSLTGYNNTVTTAVAVNAPYRQIAFDGFEDYNYTGNACAESHFNFYQHKQYLKFGVAHTGKYSLQVPASASLKTEREILSVSCTPAGDDVPYTVKECDNIGTFSPYAGHAAAQKFVLSVWAKEASPSVPCITYSMDAAIKLNDGTITTTIIPVSSRKGNIIDGWQKLEIVFEVPASTPAGSIEVALVNNASGTMYFDDIRIQPFNSSMKSMVYDPFSLRLMAELDDRNYATFYEYDRDGILVRMKKETEKGIYTIQESRSGLRKQ
jgi:hypothetical protein